MADLQDVIAVTGEKVFLLLQGSAPVTGPVDVSFQLRTEGPDIITLDFWTESLVAEAADPVANPGAVGRIPWTVNLNGVFTMPKSPAISVIFFSISGKSAAGPLQVKAANRLKIPAFKVTPNAKLRRIMIHEFPKPDGKGGFGFDEDAVQAELDKLAPEQRKLLATLDPGPTGNRIVLFITLQNENNLRMHADTCHDKTKGEPPTSIKPNATFTAFHCQGPGKEVSVICMARHFVLNMINPRTNTLIRGSQGGKKGDAWLARSNPTPPLFKVGCFAKSGSFTTDGVLWNRIFAPNGKNIMGGNTMHGMINTVGCWMLFRNYNFPKQNDAGIPIEDELDRILNRLLRDGASKKTVLAALAKVGYDAPDSGGKFTRFDANHAYAWFFREAVGIRYFSETFFGKRDANDKFAHQLVFSKNADRATVEAFCSENGDGDDPNKFIYHHIEERRKKDKSFVFDNSLIGPNALGFQTCKDFVDNLKKDLPADQVQDRTWADLYIYRADDVSVKNMKPAYFAKI
jgi:hypothetical protein